MLDTNMQTEFPTVHIPSYDAFGVLYGYEQTKDEKPDEHTALPLSTPKNFEKRNRRYPASSLRTPSARRERISASFARIAATSA